MTHLLVAEAALIGLLKEREKERMNDDAWDAAEAALREAKAVR